MTFLFKIFFSVSIFANVHVVVDDVRVTSDKQENLEIKNDLYNKAIISASEKQIIDIIGFNKFKKHKVNIYKKIMPKANKFIVSTMEKHSSHQSGNATATYKVKLSRTTLNKLLRDEGMFTSHQKQVTVLPMVKYTDKVNFKKYYWWGSDGVFASKVGRKVIKKLNYDLYTSTERKKVNVLRPISKNFNKKLSVEQKFLNLSPLEVKSIAQAFKADLVLSGEVLIKNNPKVNNSYVIDYDLKLLNVKDASIVSRFKIQAKTLPGSLNASVYSKTKALNIKILNQINKKLLSFWQSQPQDSKLITITLKGNLKYNKYLDVKRKLVTSLGAINKISEKSFSAGTIVLELDTPSSFGQLVNKVKRSKFKNYDMRLTHDSKSSLELQLKPW